ncbi:MAG: chorismate-binding protein [Pseudomonadota bacterium]
MLWAKCIADTETPVSAALKLIEPERGDWLLESVEGGETRGRYSLIGLAPDLMFRAQGSVCAINRAWALDRTAFEPIEADPLSALRTLVAECRIDPLPNGLPSALACLVGYFAYESYGLVEAIPRPNANPIAVPDMVFVRPSLILIFDRLADELWFVAPLWPSQTTPKRAVEAASERIETAISRLALPIPTSTVRPEPVEGLSFSRSSKEQCFDKLSTNGLEKPVTTLTPTLSDGAYAKMVMAAKEHITAGDIFQVVLAQRFTAPFTLPPFQLYRALRRINPSPFLYYLDLPGFAVVGSSPEILVRVRDDEVTIRPIAGTRPRGANAAQDLANRDALLADPKECAEHLMLLDLGRNDVGRAATPGSVCVTDSFMVEKYSHVMHIVSNVTGRLSAGKDALDALFAGFPAGTVSGAPKVRAAQIIAELEGETRGIYAGGIGYFGPDGGMDSCIVLRTGIVKDGILHVTAGAGIVADSDPDYEQRECEAKAGALIAAAREAVRVASEVGYGQ